MPNWRQTKQGNPQWDRFWGYNITFDEFLAAGHAGKSRHARLRPWARPGRPMDSASATSARTSPRIKAGG